MTFTHGSCKSVSEGECYVIIVLVVSLVLHREAVAHVRIPRQHMQISTPLPLPRLRTCWSSSALIVRLGATPIYVPFRPECNFMVSIVKRPPELELFFRGFYIRNYTVWYWSAIHANEDSKIYFSMRKFKDIVPMKFATVQCFGLWLCNGGCHLQVLYCSCYC